MAHKRYVTISSGSAGYYAVFVVDNEPWDTGIGRYATPEEAEAEARDWAEAEEVPFVIARMAE